MWEHEQKSPELVENRIRRYLFPRPSLDFCDLQCSLIGPDGYIPFLDCFHYQGSGRNATTAVGCFYREELVAVCLFCSVTRLETALKQKVAYDEIRELSRLCIHPSYQAKNFASWLLARSRRILKQNEPSIRLLVSFADLSYGHLGTIYKADNWKLDGRTEPSYWYVDSRMRIIHKKTIWNAAKEAGLSEAVYVRGHSLIKVKAQSKFRYVKRV